MTSEGLLVERLVRRDRLVVAACLIAATLLAWLWLFMPRAEGSMPGMGMQAVVPLAAFVMWFVMMVAMMLPSAAPMILLYAALMRRRDPALLPYREILLFSSGYLFLWAAFSALAASAQIHLVNDGGLSRMLMPLWPWLTASLLIGAGIYQLTPAKTACLRHCRSPVDFLTRHWRKGPAGALRMGLLHGAYCVGCCWLLMGLLFVGGVMNPLWIVGLALFVLLEKYLGAGEKLARVSGYLLLIAGIALSLRHLLA